MIAVSDVVLIVVSATILGFGLSRWQNNLEQAQRPVDRSPVKAQVQNTPPVRNVNSVPAAPEAPDAAAPDAAARPQVTPRISPDEPADTGTSPLGTHVVQPGDTLSALARQYGTTVTVLQSLNQINGTVINVNQELKYPLLTN